MFADMTIKARPLGLDKAVEHLNGRPLRVATMCSGTEAPILALRLVAGGKSAAQLSIAIANLFSLEELNWESTGPQTCPSVECRDRAI